MNRVLNLLLLCLFMVALAVPDAMAATSPTRQAGRISMTTSGSDVTFNWRRGDGEKVAVFIMAGNTWDSQNNPENGTDYTGSVATAYTAASGTAQCVYTGTGTTVTVTGLTAGSQYTVYAFEYNETGGAPTPAYCTAQRLTNPATFIAPLPGLALAAGEPKVSQNVVHLAWENRPAGANVLLNYTNLSTGATVTQNIGNADSWVIMGLTHEQQYAYQIAYVTTQGAVSNWLTGTFTAGADAVPTIVKVHSNLNAGTPNVVNKAYVQANLASVYYIDVEFSEIMDYNDTPDITFQGNGDVNSTVISKGEGEWIPELQNEQDDWPFEYVYRQYFSLLDNTEEFSGAIVIDVAADDAGDMTDIDGSAFEGDGNVAITGAENFLYDTDGLLSSVSEETVASYQFYIDTKAPVVTTAAINADCFKNTDNLVVSLGGVSDGGYDDAAGDQIHFTMEDGIADDVTLGDADPNYTLTVTVADGDVSGDAAWKVTDDAGNETTVANDDDGAFAYIIDNSAPSAVVAVTSGACSSPTGTVTFTVTVTDENGCGTWNDSHITLSGSGVDNIASLTADEAATLIAGNVYSYSFDIAGEASGTYEIIATPTDPAGNPGAASAAATFSVDNTPPSITSVSYTRLTDNNTSTHSFNADGTGAVDLRVVVRVTDANECGDFGTDLGNNATPATGAAKLEFTKKVGTGAIAGFVGAIDAATDARTYITNVNEFSPGVWDITYEFDLEGATGGDINFSVTATDKHNNASAETDVANSIINVDILDPTFTSQPALVGAPADDCYVGGNTINVTMDFDATSVVEAGSYGNVQEDVFTVNKTAGPDVPQEINFVLADIASAATVTQTMSADLTGLTAESYTGDYTYTVTGVDRAGNSVTSADLTFSIDNTAPTATAVWKDDAATDGSANTITCASVGQTVYLHVTLTETGCGTMDGAIDNANGGLTVTANNFTDNLAYTDAAPANLNPSYTFVYETTIDAADNAGDNVLTYTVTDSKGNASTGNTATIYIDKTAPSVIVNTLSQSCFKTGGTLSFNVTALDPAPVCGTFDASNLQVWLEESEPANTVYDVGTDIMLSVALSSGNTYTYSRVIDGTESGNVYALAIDDAGNQTGFNSPSLFTIDNTAPTAAVTIVDACLNNTQTLTANVLVTEAGDCGLSGYTATVTGAGKGTADPVLAVGPTDNLNGTYSLQYTVDLSQETAYAEGTYTFSFNTNDAAGNSMVAPETATFTVDNTPQTISAITFTDACVDGSLEFEFTISDVNCNPLEVNEYNTPVITDPSGNDPVLVGGAPADNDGSYTWTYTLNVADLNEAGNPYQIAVNYTDDFDNASDEVTGTFNIDRSLPSIANLEATPTCAVDATGTEDVTITFDMTDAASCALDASNITTATVTGGVLSTPSIDGSTVTYTVNLFEVADGDYTFTVEVTDDAGNASGASNVGFTVDNSAPELSLLSDNATCVKDGDVINITFTVTDAEECSALTAANFTISAAGVTVDAADIDVTGANSPYTVSADLTLPDALPGADVADGDYDITVAFADNAGNPGVAADGHSLTIPNAFTVDNTKPTLGTPVLVAEEPTCIKPGTEVDIQVSLTDNNANCNTFDAARVTVDKGALNGAVAVAAALTEGNIIITYTAHADDANGLATLPSITYEDEAGNVSIAVAATELFSIDKVEPAVNAASLSITDDQILGTCFGDSRDIEFSFSVVEEGCGTFVSPTNIEVTIIDAGAHNYSATYVGRTGTGTVADPYVFTYSYTFVGEETNGAATISVDVMDDAGNHPVAVVLNDGFSIDNAVPTITLSAKGTCETAGTVDFSVVVTDASTCGTLNQDDITITLEDASATPVAIPVAFLNEAPAGTFNYRATVASNHATGYASITATIKDDAQNTSSDVDAQYFQIDNTKPTVTSITVLDQGDNVVDCITTGNYKLQIGVTDLGCGTLTGALTELQTADPGKIFVFLPVFNANLTFSQIVSNVGDDYVFEYTFTIPQGDEGGKHVRVLATDSKGNLSNLYDPAGFEFTIDPLNHTIATTTTTNAVGTCLGTGKVITATLNVNVDENSCGGVENVEAELEFSDNSTVWMTPAAGNPAPVGGLYPDGTYEFTYTVDSEDPNGALLSVTGYLNHGLNAVVADADEALNLVLDTDAPTVTPNAAFALGCLGNGADAVFTDIVVDDNAVCSDIDETNIEVELYTAEGGTFRTLTSATDVAIASTYTYDDQNNHFDFTYVIQGDEPQGEAIGVRLNVTDNAGNSVEDQVVDADAFSVDYEGPVVSNIAVSETCVKYTEVEGTPTTTLDVTFDVEEAGCGTFDASNITIAAVNGGTTLTLASTDNPATIVVAGNANDGYTVTGTFTIPDVEGEYTITLTVDDDQDNVATMAVEDPATGNAAGATITAVPTFRVDNSGPVFAEVNAPAKIALYTYDGQDYTLVTDACVTDGNYYLGVEPSDAGCDGIVGTSVVYTPNQAVAGQFYVSASTFANTVDTPIEVGGMYYIPLAIASTDDGTEEITLSLFDGLLNESEELTYSIDVDNVGPVVSDIDIAEADQCVAYTEDGGQNPTTEVDVTFHVEEDGCGAFDAANVSATATNGTTTLNGSITSLTGNVNDGYDVTATFTILSNTTDGLYTVSLVIDDDKDNYATMDGAEPAATGTAVGATITAEDKFYVDNAGPVVSNIQLDKSCVKYTDDGDEEEPTPTTVVTATFHVEEAGCGTFNAGNIDADARTSWNGPFSIAGVVTDVDGETPQTGYDVTVEFTVPQAAINGPYQVELTIDDDNGNAADFDGTEDPATGFIDGIIYSEATFTVDNDAPSITAMDFADGIADACLTTGAVISGTVTVNQTGCSPVNAVTVYLDLPGGVETATVGTPSGNVYPFTYTIQTVDGSGDVDVYATATDGLGTTSTEFDFEDVDFSLDQLKPTSVAIASGQDGGCYNHTQTITLTVSADIDAAGCLDQDDITIEFTGLGGLNAQLSANQPTGPVDTKYTWEYTIDIPENTTEPVVNYDGLYTIAATVNDGNGAVSAGSISFTVDNTPAALSLSSITDACLNQTGTLAFSFLVTEEVTGTDCYDGLNNLSFTDPSTANNVQTNVTDNEDGTWTVEATLLLSDVAQGDKQVTVNYTDDANNASTQLAVNFHVSTALPVVSAITVSDNCVNSLLPYSFTVADNSTCGDGINAAEYWIELTGNPAAGDADGTMTISEGTFSGNIDISGLANGQYDLIVVYTDDAGNSDEEIATFTVDKTAPAFAAVNENLDQIALYTEAGGVYSEVTDNCIQGGSYYLGVAPSDAGCDIVASDVVETTPVSGQFFMTSTTFANSIVTDDGVIEGAGDYAGMYFIPLTVANDEEGSKSVVLSIYDGAMNESEDLTYSITVDNDAPAIALGTVTACSNTEIAYSFTIDDTDCDENGVNNATVSIWTTAIPAVQVGGNISVASSSSNETVNTYTGTLDVSAYASGTYTLKVDYIDDSDNESDAASTTFNVDTDGPVVSTIALDDNCIKDGQSVTMTFNVTDNDICSALAAGNISAEAVNGSTTITGTDVTYNDQTGDASVTFAFPASPQTAHDQGAYSIALIIADPAGNTAEMAEEDVTGTVNGQDDTVIDVTPTFTLDNAGPVIAFTDMTPDEDDCYKAGQTVSIEFSVEDGSCGGAGATPVVTITLPKEAPNTVAATVTGTYPNYTATYLATANDGTGTATVSVTAADGLGNANTNASLATFSIDNSVPVVDNFTLISTPTCYKADQTVTFAVDYENLGCATQDIALWDGENNGFEVDIYNGNNLINGNIGEPNEVNGKLQFTYTVDAADVTGSYTVEFNIVDSKGMEGYLVQSSAFTIDNSKPTLTLVSPTNPPTCVEPGDIVTFQVNASDVGCGTFDEDDITVTVTNGTPANISAVTPVNGDGYNYEFTYTVAGTVETPVDVAPIINITASDDLGNTLLAPVTHAMTVDVNPLDIAIDLPQTTCVSQITDGTFVFDVTATNLGCDTDIEDLTVTVQATGETAATTLTGSEGTYTYTIPTGSAYTGEATITVTAVDGFANTVTETSTFMIDNTAPAIAGDVTITNNATSGQCLGTGNTITTDFTIADADCADLGEVTITYDFSDGTDATYSSVGDFTINDGVVSHTHTIVEVNGTGTCTVTVNAVDTKGNAMTPVNGDVVNNIDQTGPTLTLVNTPPTCVEPGDVVTFQVNASDVGCGVFNEDDITVTVTDGTSANISTVSAVDGQTNVYEFTYTVAGTVATPVDVAPIINITASDDLGNTLLAPVTHAMTVDVNPLDIAIDLPQTTCVSQITDGTFVFDVTATNLGCDTDIEDLTVTVQATGETVATTLTGSEGTYTYTLPVGPTYTGEATITVTAVDGFGNTITETAPFMIDNTAPAIAGDVTITNNATSGQCLGTGNTITTDFTIADAGCANLGEVTITYDFSDGTDATYSSVGDFTINDGVVSHTHTIVEANGTGTCTVTVNAVDTKGNAMTPVNGDVVNSIDQTGPTLTLVNTPPTCVEPGDIVTFQVNASDVGCGTFNEDDITVTVTNGTPANISAVTPVTGQTTVYEFTYTVAADDLEEEILGDVAPIINITASDDLGNTLLAPVTHAMTVDLNPLDIAIDLLGVTCVSKELDGNLVFDVTATNLGCDQVVSNLTVTVTPFGGNATTVTESEGVYTYTIPQGSTYTGEATITVTAVDGFNNTITETATFMIDNTAPVLSAYSDDAECVGALLLTINATQIHFSVNAEDLGCGTFAHSDINVTMTSSSGLPLVGNLTTDGSTGTVFNYVYTVHPQDPTGDVNITFNLVDSKGNIAVTYAPTDNANDGSEFKIDNTAPMLSNLEVSKQNAVEGDNLSITFDLADAGCAVTNQPVVTLTFADNSNTTATYASGSGNGTYTYSYTVPTSPVEGGVNVKVNSSDALGNTDVLDPANFEFVIISNTPADVTSIVVNDMMVEDADAGNNFTVAVTYSQPMDVTQNAPVVTFDPTVGGTFTNGSGAWSNGNQTYTMTYTIVDAGICVDDVDVSVTGGQNTVGIAANGGTEANLFDVYMCSAANARADIVFAGNEANGISSLTNGDITTSTNGTRVLKLTVRDDITTDTDTKPTNVTALTINAAGSNQAAFDTHIHAAALFNAAGTKLCDAVITAGALTFSNLSVSCADNSTYDMYLRLTVKNPLPAGADGKRLVFTLANTNVTVDANSTPLTTFTNTSSTAASNNVIQVVVTQLAFVDQPTNATVGVAEPVEDNVTVKAQDANGNIDTDAAFTVNMSITNTTAISNGGSANMLSGVATFSGLTYQYAASGVALTATPASPFVANAISNTFNITPPAPAAAAALNLVSKTSSTILLQWNSNGANSLLLAIQGSEMPSAVPAPQTAYTNTNGAFSIGAPTYTSNCDEITGSLIGGGTANARVVYFGSDQQINVTGLQKLVTYTFKLYTFNSDATFTASTVVYAADGPTATITTSKYKEAYANVELRSFDVTSADAQAFLDWETIRETDNVGFEVHRAEMTEAGLEPFEMITSYEDNSALAGLNESEFGKKYKLTDDDAVLAIGATYVYRLVSVASDGYKQVQAERSVLINGAASMSVSEIQPNPVVTDLKFDLDMVESRKVTIQIYSLEGTLVAQPILDKEYGMGLHKVSIDLDRSMIPAGTYTLKVISGDNEAVSKRFVVVR